MAKRQTRRRVLSIALCIAAPVVVFLALTSASVHHDQFCTQCGAQRWANAIHIGPTPIRLTTRSGQPKATTLSKLHDRLHQPCSQHSWRTYHGYGRYVLSRFTFSGNRPIGREIPGHVLDNICQRDPEFARDIIDHIIALNESGDWRRQEPMRDWLWHLPGESSSSSEKDIARWREWWAGYRQTISDGTGIGK